MIQPQKNIGKRAVKYRGRQLNKPVLPEYMIQPQTSKANVIRTLEYLVKKAFL